MNLRYQQRILPLIQNHLSWVCLVLLAIGLGSCGKPEGAEAGCGDSDAVKSIEAAPDPKEPGRRLEEGEPAYTAEQIDGWTRELAPLVEEFAGRRFERVPAVRVADRAALVRILELDLEDHLARLAHEEIGRASCRERV